MNHRRISTKTKGFTLIELLVVIAIIGVLATLIVTQLQTARSKSRDAKRISDVSQIQTAVELYYGDYGYYPTDIGASITKYMSNGKVPKDPLGFGKRDKVAIIDFFFPRANAVVMLPTSTYYYAYDPAVKPTRYHIYAELERYNGALAIDADIDSSGWGGGNVFNASPASTEACSNASYRFGNSKQCIFDLGLK